MIEIDFNTHDLAVLMGVTRRTVQLWLSGSNTMPQACALLLLAIADEKITLDWIVDQIAPRSKMN